MDILGDNSPVLMNVISSDLQRKLIESAVTQRFADGQLVHSRGQDKSGLSIVKSGQVRLGTYGISGDFIPTAVMNAGVSLGEHTVLLGLPRILDCIAHGPTEIYHISRDKFELLYKNEPDIGKALLEITLVRLHGTLEFVDDLRRLSLPVRTAKLLLSFVNASKNDFVVNGLQSELAATLGVTRVTFGKALAQLVALGFVELGYRQITITNIKALTAWLDKQTEVTPLRVKSKQN